MSLAEDIEYQVGCLEATMEDCYDDAKRKIWKTKDGCRIPYSEMTTTHLTNTINFVKRKSKDHWMRVHLPGLQNGYKKRLELRTPSSFKYNQWVKKENNV